MAQQLGGFLSHVLLDGLGEIEVDAADDNFFVEGFGSDFWRHMSGLKQKGGQESPFQVP
jgi:hypothetical protein